MFTSKVENRIEAVKSSNRLTESWLRAGELNATRMAYESSMTPVHLPAKELVREAGVEPAASRLSIECSNHAELFPVVLLTQRVGPRARFELTFPEYRSGASPTMLTGLEILEPMERIERSSVAYHATALPLSYRRGTLVKPQLVSGQGRL